MLTLLQPCHIVAYRIGVIKMDRDLILEQLTALDFMAVDLGLYLNTNPDDREALMHYNSIILNAQNTRERFEEYYGPLCSFRSGSNPDVWRWVDCPWPWEEDANFSLNKEGC